VYRREKLLEELLESKSITQERCGCVGVGVGVGVWVGVRERLRETEEGGRE
jgi:hypothetical protein